jgi:4-hydroxybenzoate polyprenyltransferase
MWLFTLALLGLLIGYDLRSRAQDMSHDDSRGATAIVMVNANAVGAWISFGGGICLNLAVWSVF